MKNEKHVGNRTRDKSGVYAKPGSAEVAFTRRRGSGLSPPVVMTLDAVSLAMMDRKGGGACFVLTLLLSRLCTSDKTKIKKRGGGGGSGGNADYL